MFSLTDAFNQMMNFKNIFRWHLPFLLILSLCSLRAVAQDTLLILGDSLSAGYQLPLEDAWATRLARQWQQDKRPVEVVNASISGDTAAQGLARLPALLAQHKPRWVLIELGANDGLRGFPPADIKNTLAQIIALSRQSGAEPWLMQIRMSPSYGKRYGDAFAAIYPELTKQYQIPLIPFYMEQVVTNPQWMQQDGIHPNAAAQPFIAQWMSERLLPLISAPTKG